MNFLTLEEFDVSLERSVESVQHNLADLDSIDDFVFAGASLNLDHGGVMLLSSGSWVNSRPIENQKIRSVFLSHISEHVKNCSVVLNQIVIVVEYSFRFRNVSCLVKNLLLLLGGSLLPHSNLVVKILRNWGFDNLRDFISWNTVRLHASHPIIKSKLSFPLLHNFLKFSD
jgi:hypothetical protein